MPTPEDWARLALDRYRTASEEPASADEWTIEMMSHTQNGIVWHGRHPHEADFAVKISVVDDRRRGEHEFQATQRLASLGYDIAPRPLLLLEDEGLFALVSSWCPGTPFSEHVDWRSPAWSRIVLTYASLHEVPCDGLPFATPYASIEIQLDSAAEFGRQAGWHHVDDLLRVVRSRIGGDIPRERHAGFVHWDTNPSNILIDDATVRFVDWEYGGIGDPSGDIANLCTSPSIVDMPNELAKRLIEEHAQALGGRGLVDRTNAWVLTMLTYWCCRSGASLQNGIAERDINPNRSAVARIEQYSERLAELLGLSRTEIDYALGA